MGKKTKTSLKYWELRQKRGRRFKVLSLRKKYLIVTNGETEAAYFENYRGSTGPKIRIARRLKDPCLLVKKAIAERERRAKRGETFHETWIVMDRDKFVANNGDEAQFQAALKSAEENNIQVAYSDDAFELWYVLHYQDVNTPTTRKELVKLLEKHRVKRYEKGVKGDLYHEILHLRAEATRRAHLLLKQAESQAPTINPCTRVHLLVEKLIENDPRLSQ
jgi:hypothetical protein